MGAELVLSDDAANLRAHSYNLGRRRESLSSIDQQPLKTPIGVGHGNCRVIDGRNVLLFWIDGDHSSGTDQD